MRLYLCGGGSNTQIKEALMDFARNIDKSKPILYIPLAMNYSKYADCYKWFKKELEFVNIYKFEMVYSAEELSKKDFSQYSALFIGGGNTYKLLSDIKKYNNFQKIYDYLNNGGVIFGGSAGAIIFGKDINSCLIEDKNDVKLEDTTGFNLLNDFCILCHLNDVNFNKNFKYLQDYSKQNKVIYLPEEDVLLVQDNKVFIFGSEKYYVFKDGKYFFHNTNKDFEDVN